MTAFKTLPTFELCEAGQSPWLDYLGRELLENGILENWIREKGVMGVTSNPSIFDKAISQPGGFYEPDIRRFFRKGASTFEVYDALTISDITRACDLFLPVFKKTAGEHGFVSLEVSPDLAYHTDATLREARRLFKIIARPNLMIKIPATPEGIPAVASAIAEGININITLIFSMKHYQDVAAAYLDGLARFKTRKGRLEQVHSVASVFVSRLDTLLDKKLEAMAAQKADPLATARLLGLRGKAAIANSKIIYREFKKIFGSEKFRTLRESGARLQKVLWGSTSSKNPNYPDLVYVENLIGPATVNTMPQNTLEAFWDHGIVRRGSIEEGFEEARDHLHELAGLGLDAAVAGETLQKEGVQSFKDAFRSLMKSLEYRRVAAVRAVKPRLAKLRYLGGPSFPVAAAQKTAQLESSGFFAKFLKQDPSLWKEDAGHQKVIANRLGWLRASEAMTGRLYELDLLRREVREAGLSDIVLLGMGGSSLAPEVLKHVFSKNASTRRFHVLDTTDPASILKLERSIRLSRSLFIVASKSGSTIETMSQFAYFYERVSKAIGKSKSAGDHFIAITDPGSDLEKMARQRCFRRTFLNPADIGGRFSALSLFGLVPAALMGINTRGLLASAGVLLTQTTAEHRLVSNPGIYLGVLLAELYRLGRDKMTILAAPSLQSFGAWLEQLVAESTGKEKKGIIPVDAEPLISVPSYGNDRFFVVLSRKGDSSAVLQKRARALAKAGHPVLIFDWPEPEAIGAEFLRWEIATSVAGAVMGINPFDEPNVKESKDNTGVLLEKFRKTGRLQAEDAVTLRSNPDLREFLKKIPDRGYLAFLVFLERGPQTQKLFSGLRKAITERYKIPVLLGYGPRYLHSIGQLYKGGPEKGAFVFVLNQEGKDPRVPGAPYTFGQLKKAQAIGDLQAIKSRGIPFLCLDLGANVTSGLAGLDRAFRKP